MTLRGCLVVPALCLLFLGDGCLFDGSYKHRGPTTPEKLEDGWEIATPESVGLDPAALATIQDELLREDRHFGALAFLVVKDGKLVFETYLRSAADRDRLNHLQSATKSVTSLVFGIARDRGWVPELDTPLCTVLVEECAELEERKHAITLRHLLTMTSGLAFDNDDFSIEMWVDRPSQPILHILEKSMYAAPGETFRYRDADPQLISYVLQRLTGRSEESLAVELLLEPLGIHDYLWESGPDGVSMGAHGLYLRPRDLARLGQLVLDGGVWQGEAVVPAEWVASSTASQRTIEEPVGSLHYEYGYYWWILPDERAFAAWGHGGQFVLVVPDQRLVLVQTALADQELHGSMLDDFVELTGPLWRGR